MRLLVVAGEVSGDQHASALVDALRARVAEVQLVGVGGDGLAARGATLLAHQKELAVVGLVEALSKIRFARRLIHRLVDEARASHVDAAVLVDSPDFNLPLAKRLAKAGVPVVFYVSPQVWAWRSRRARTLNRIGKAILVLFGFEKRWYEARGLGAKVTWVGHPLVDAARHELAIPHPGPPKGRRRVVLMPGSRSGEIHRNLPAMSGAMKLLRETHADADVVLIRADSISDAQIRAAAGVELDRWQVVTGPHLALLASSDVLVVASGTATVEGLLAQVPMVVVYRVNRLSFWIGKRIVNVKDIAMANIVSNDGSGTRAVPELIQQQATPEKIAAEVRAYLDDPARVAATRARLARGLADLGPAGAADRTADALLYALGKGV